MLVKHIFFSLATMLLTMQELVSSLATMERAPLTIFVSSETGVRRVACGCLTHPRATSTVNPAKRAKKAEKEARAISRVWDWLDSSPILSPDSPMSP